MFFSSVGIAFSFVLQNFLKTFVIVAMRKIDFTKILMNFNSFSLAKC